MKGRCIVCVISLHSSVSASTPSIISDPTNCTFAHHYQRPMYALMSGTQKNSVRNARAALSTDLLRLHCSYSMKDIIIS